MPVQIEQREDGQHVTLEFQPAPMAKTFIEDRTRVTGFFGPLGCGKTTAGAWKTYLYGQRWPGARIAVVRDTWPNLRDTSQKTFFEWFPEGPLGHYAKTTRTYFMETEDPKRPIEVLFRAMDDKEDVSNVLSLDLAAVWIDEPQGGLAVRTANNMVNEPGIDHELFLLLLGRLGRQKGYPGMCWLSGNPPDPQHWIAREFKYDGRGEPKNDRENFRLYNGTRDTNRMNLQHWYEGEAESCTLCGKDRKDVTHEFDYYQGLEELYGTGTPLALRFIQGRWVSFAMLNPFQADWIRFYDERPNLKDCYVTMGIDPAISKKDDACRSALVVAAQPLHGPGRTAAYILKAIAGHWTPYELTGKILRLLQEFPELRRIRLESNGWQGALKDIVEREAASCGMHLPFIDAQPAQADKLLRAMRQSPFVENGHVLFGPGQRELVDAMLAVPRDKTAWDLVDAMGHALEGLPNLRAEHTPIEDPSAGQKKRAESYALKTTSGGLLEAPRGFWKSAKGFGREPQGPRLQQRARGYAMHLLP